MFQRLAAGLLRQIGLVEGIGDSRDSYVATAVRFAQRCRNPKDRKRRREAMRTAAAKADANLPGVRALERVLIEAARP